jgi:hypothetical protein
MSFKLSLASAALFSAVGACFGMITSTQADLLNLTLDGVKFTDGGAASQLSLSRSVSTGQLLRHPGLIPLRLRLTRAYLVLSR